MENNDEKTTVNVPVENKRTNKGVKVNNTPKYKIDEVTENLVKKIKFNADFRHFIALRIVAILKEQKIYPEDAKLYVKFFWNKFTISNSGLNNDYTYDKSWVLSAINDGINDALDNVAEALKAFGIAKDILEV